MSTPTDMSRLGQAAIALRALADRISQNDGAAFGGAFLVAPPEGGGDILSTLIIDSRVDPAQFYALLKTKAEMALNELLDQQRNQTAFGRR